MRDRMKVLTSLCHRNAGLETRDDIQEMNLMIRKHGGSQVCRHPVIRGSALKDKITRKHANNTEVRATKRNLSPHNVRIAGVSPLPKRIADYRHPGCLAILGVSKNAADEWLDTEYGEEIRRHRLSHHLFRRTIRAEVARYHSHSGHTRKDAILAFPLGIVARRWRRPRISYECCVLPYHRQAVRIAIWKRPQQNGIHGGEDRCIRPDAKGECQHGNRGEARCLA